MKKNLAKKVTLSILAGAVLMSSSVVWAGQIIEPEPKIYWEYRDGIDGCVRLPANTKGDVSLVIEDYGDLDSAEAFYGAVSFEEGTTAANGIVTINDNLDRSYTFTGDIYGGAALIDGEDEPVSDANNNKVFITTSKATIMSDVYGGYAKDGNAEGNSVTITGGTFEGYLAGGCASGGNATGNTITISGSANLANTTLVGGSVSGAISTFGGGPSIGGESVGGGEVSGNTLNIGTDSSSWSGKVESIRGFDSINFNNVAWEKGGTVVQATDLELNNTTITANIKSGTLTEENEMMKLISTENDIVGSIATTGNTVNVGIAESYEGVISQEDKAIVITLTGTPSSGDTGDEGTGNEGTGNTTPQPSRNDQVLVLGESRAAAVAFTNQGSELIETGLNALARDNEKDTKVFAAVYGNHSEYETGSHVNVNGWSGIVGIGKTNADGLTVGAFFENGEGNYSTHNIFTNDYIRGDGEACYNGGGFLVRKDNANGVYAEASLRAGNLQNELRNAVRNGSELTGYDIDTFYYGAHVGIGKVIARGNDGDSVDVYGKFIYTHHDGETFDIGGTATKFDSVESERLRLGFRINEVQTNKLSMYYGAAWEYEFNGDAHDKIASYDLETPSLEGSTVIGEIGAHYKASEKWSLDLNGRAYLGQREGFSGSVQANYAF